MDERERAVVATHVVTAMKNGDPSRLTPTIEQLSLTPWDEDVVVILKAVRRELDRQKHAAKSTKSKK